MNPVDRAQALFEQLVAWRRDFHQHPELGLQEHRSAGIVADALSDLGYAVQEGVANTGVVGLLENGPGPVIMARFDMDALPIQEESDASYTSVTPGLMHACGHDAHMAIGLGVARLMVESREQWRGTLKLVFQPGEEGYNGAEIMVREGVLENPRPDKVLALHVWNNEDCGRFSVTPGPVMAAAEAWEAKITGKGGHAAMPEFTVDPVVAAATIVTALQSVVSRNVGAQQTAVVTVGQITSGDTFNVIPDQALLRGTIRTFEPAVRETVLRRVREIIEGVAQAMGAQVRLSFQALTPAVINDPEVAALVQETVKELYGPQALNPELRTMGSEDAAFFLQEIPGCYFFVGSKRPGEPEISHHNPHFDIDERALPLGVSVLVAALHKLLAASEA